MSDEEPKARIEKIIDNWVPGTATNDVFGVDVNDFLPVTTETVLKWHREVARTE
ncbi:MAG: hypothetical protein ACTILB_16620 [Brevibacterium aurantiacum]